MRRRQQNGKCEYDGERGKRPETKSVDDHGRVLPLARQLRPLVVGSHLGREGPQLAEDRLEDGLHPAGTRRCCLHAFVTRPDGRRRLLVCACARRLSDAVAVVDRTLW